MRILLIEDDRALGGALRDFLAGRHHAVDWAMRAEEARDALATVHYDLLLLDLMLPDGRGLDLLKESRSGGASVPVIILTARDKVSERIEGLNAGADDYLVKPFDLSELNARIMAVSRRYTGEPNPTLHLGSLEVDLVGKTVRKGGSRIQLTAREWAIFEALIEARGATLSKSSLEERLYGFGDEFESNTIEVHVSRIRKKLGHDLIQTVRGLGYRLER